jgi:hypothetical protein
LAVLPLGEVAGFTGAVEVIEYSPGALSGGTYTNPQTALGWPERFTGEGAFPGVVSPFNPPFLPSEIVSIGEGGHLTLRLGESASDDAAHLYGVDLLIFGNAAFIDADFPNGATGNPATLFGADGGMVEVSADGVTFHTVVGALADGLFPTLGYLDSGPFDSQPGQVPSDFTRPVNPALRLNELSGLSYAQLLAAYDGSGGGAPLDLALAGVSSAQYVRISVPDDGNPNVNAPPIEVDAVTVVPEPAGATFLLLASFATCRRRLRRRDAEKN